MATKTWRGGAAAVAQVTTITYSAYTSGQTYTITCNQKSLSFTATASTLANVIDGLVALLEAATDAEWVEVSAVNSSGLVLTAVTAGKPFTITSTATGAITATVTETTAATGPNHFDEGANWEGGTAPVAADDLVFADSSYSVMYGIVDTGNNYGDITVDSTFTGEIGLPADNPGGYREYRPRFLKLGDGSGAFAVTIGQGQGGQSSRILIDANAGTVTGAIYNTGNGLSNDIAVVIKNGDSSSEYDIYGGSVHLDCDTSASMAALRITPDNGSAAVLCDQGVACGAVTIAGGQLEIRGSATSITASAGAQVTVSNSAACGTVSVSDGANVRWNSTGNISTALFSYNRGLITFAGNSDSKTVAAATIYSGGSILDPHGCVTWSAGVVMTSTTLEEVTLNLGRGKTVSV